jgi:hydroxymethylglutaryl-CoA synthase
LKKAVVIASDYAKYELASSGEYTQGGGAGTFGFCQSEID